MKRITDFAEVSPLVLKHFKRGVITNSFLTPEDYKAEIAEGNLYFEEIDGNLLLYVRREDFWRCFFYIINDKNPFPEYKEKIILEVGERAFNLAEKNGFTRVMERIELKLDAAPQCERSLAERAKNAEKVYEILQSSFNKFTGNLPGLTQLKSECETGRIFAVIEDGEYAGILRSENNAKIAQIKHLAVREKYRGRGFAKELVRVFLAENQGKKCTVWTGSDNFSAIGLYEGLGFEKTGSKTRIYMKG